MPLVFAVLIIIAIFVSSSERNKRQESKSARYAVNMRKTNATLEYKLLNKYMEYGFSFEKAFCETYEDMAKAGYEPCIPMNAYEVRKGYAESRRYPHEYDSDLVKSRRENIEKKWRVPHPNEDSEDIEREIYKDFPKTEFEYELDLKRMTRENTAIPSGEYLIYPGLGTCKVLEVVGNCYRVKSLSSGDTKYISIDDPKISKIGRS